MQTIVIHVYFSDNQKRVISGYENESIIELINRSFNLTKSENYTFEARFMNMERKILKGENKLISILKLKHLSSHDFKIHLIDLRKFIDIFFDQFAKNVLLEKQDKIRYYCDNSTTVRDMELYFEKVYKTKRRFGLFGYVIEHDDLVFFKLKPDDHLLEIKRVFSQNDFFRYRLYEFMNLRKSEKDEYIGRFYKVKRPGEFIIFKRCRKYVLRENNLLQLENNNVRKTFFDISKSKIQIEIVNKILYACISNKDAIWILRGKNKEAVTELYNHIMYMKKMSHIDSHCYQDQKSEDNDIQNTTDAGSEIEQSKLDDDSSDFDILINKFKRTNRLQNHNCESSIPDSSVEKIQFKKKKSQDSLSEGNQKDKGSYLEHTFCKEFFDDNEKPSSSSENSIIKCSNYKTIKNFTEIYDPLEKRKERDVDKINNAEKHLQIYKNEHVGYPKSSHNIENTTNFSFTNRDRKDTNPHSKKPKEKKVKFPGLTTFSEQSMNTENMGNRYSGGRSCEMDFSSYFQNPDAYVSHKSKKSTETKNTDYLSDLIRTYKTS